MLTEKSQSDKFQTCVPQPDIHAGRCSTGTNAGKIEPFRHERFLGVRRFFAGTRGVGVKGIVAWPKRGYHEQNERCERKLDHHMQT